MSRFQCFIFRKSEKGTFKRVKCQLFKKWPDLYCYFNKIIKGPETSFQSPALSQKHVSNVCHTTH